VLLTAGPTPHVKLSHSIVATRLSIEQHEQRFGVCGTPRYMAPEVAFREYSFPADVYSFGVCLYELLHERRFLVDQCAALDILVTVMRNNRPKAMLDAAQLEALDAAGVAFTEVVARIIERCWQHAWEQRPTMADVASCIAASREALQP
jgi:serine/threonine protein kinase